MAIIRQVLPFSPVFAILIAAAVMQVLREQETRWGLRRNASRGEGF
jgi:hypothetical protein